MYVGTAKETYNYIHLAILEHKDNVFVGVVRIIKLIKTIQRTPSGLVPLHFLHPIVFLCLKTPFLSFFDCKL